MDCCCAFNDATGPQEFVEEYLRQFVEKEDPKEAELAVRYIAQGDAYVPKHYYLNALKQYTAAVSLNPRNPAAHLRVAQCWADTYRLELALTTATYAEKLTHRSDPEVYYRRALIHVERTDWKRAFDDAARAMELDCSNATYRSLYKRLRTRLQRDEGPLCIFDFDALYYQTRMAAAQRQQQREMLAAYETSREAEKAARFSQLLTTAQQMQQGVASQQSPPPSVSSRATPRASSPSSTSFSGGSEKRDKSPPAG